MHIYILKNIYMIPPTRTAFNLRVRHMALNHIFIRAQHSAIP